MDKLERDEVTHPAVRIHKRLLLDICFAFRLLMSVFVVPKVPGGSGLLVLTIACRCRPGELERQNEQHEDQDETSHFLETVRGACSWSINGLAVDEVYMNPRSPALRPDYGYRFRLLVFECRLLPSTGFRFGAGPYFHRK